jgi:hypothetical protein
MDGAQRKAGLGLEDKVAIVTGGEAVEDGIGNGPPGPVGIEGTGWNIGCAVRFLLSADARYITGHTLVVDGGVTLVGPAREPG